MGIEVQSTEGQRTVVQGTEYAYQHTSVPYYDMILD